MQKAMSLVLCLIFSVGLVTGQEKETRIVFEDTAWLDLLAKAKAEDKLIFVDVYTTWCGPCKSMAKEVFTDASIAKYYNQNFINAHIDAEEGEGIQFARKYKVQAYPSLLFINETGEVVHRAIGYHDVAAFAQLGQTAISPAGGLLRWNQQYQQGERSPVFLRKLIMAKYNAMEKGYMEMAKTYLRSQKDWSTLSHMQLIYTLIDDPSSDWFEYMVNHRSQFDLLFGREAVATKLQQLFLKKPLGSQGIDPMAEVDRFYSKVYPDLAPKLSAHFKMNYFRTIGDMKAFTKAADQYLGQFASKDSNELNNIAWTFFEYAEDKEMLLKAVGWAEQSVAISRGYHNLDTLANLYYKVGKRSKAKKAAKQAIALAKADGVELMPTQQLLDQLRGK